MTYLETIDRELRALLSQGDHDATAEWVKDRLLESFRNGQRMPKKKVPVPRNLPTGAPFKGGGQTVA